jgi:hypothetical protein
MNRNTSRTRRVLALGSVLVAAGATAVASSPMSVPAVAQTISVDITIQGPTTVAPGGILHFTGTCSPGGTQEAHVRGYLDPGQGLAPFDFSYQLSAHPTTGAFTGGIFVPGDAPNGAYHLSVDCGHLDASYGHDDTPAPFTIDGPQITTTTTTTATPRPPLQAEPRVVGAAPAVPRLGTATLTG